MGIVVRSNFLSSDLVDYRQDKIASLGENASRRVFSRYSLSHHVLLLGSIGRRALPSEHIRLRDGHIDRILCNE